VEPPASEPFILAVEDDPAAARLLTHLLVPAAGWTPQLLVRDSLQAGLARLAVGGVDVVLLDLNLPDSRGLDTLARVRHAAPGLPVVVMSSLEDETTALIAVQQGAQDYVVKGSVDEQGLRRVVRYAMERQRLLLALAEARETLRMLSGLLPVCAWCGRMRDDEGCWHAPAEYMRRRTAMEVTHGICPSCRAGVVEPAPPPAAASAPAAPAAAPALAVPPAPASSPAAERSKGAPKRPIRRVASARSAGRKGQS